MRTSPTFLGRTLAAALMASGLAVAATAAHAYKPYVPPSLPYLKSDLVQMDVYNRTTGTTLPIYPNAHRHWIEGVPGHEYAVRIRNTTAGRILVVTSVDGVNVISGDTASPAQSGYVLEPYGSVEIAGWRKSLTRTAAFYFTDLGDSYAARTGRPQNVGVIGVAVFQEKAKARIAYNEWDWRSRSNAHKEEAQSRTAAAADAVERAENGGAAPPPPVAQAAPAPASPHASGAASESAAARAEAVAPSRDAPRHPSLEAAKPMAKLGTGHGRNEESRVTTTAFERATTYPAETLTVQYDRRDNLVAMGVLPQPIPPIARREPNPFPAVRFAPDPR